MMSCFDVSVVTTCEKGSGVSFLDKTMKKELYGLGSVILNMQKFVSTSQLFLV